MNELLAFWSAVILFLFGIAISLGLLIATLKLAFDHAGKIVLSFIVLFVILIVLGAL